MHLPASYRDPSGFVFEKEGVLYRQINKYFGKTFNHFIDSGLYQHLATEKLLIQHALIAENITGSPDWFATLKPELIPVISYPYEWCFNLLKDAALLTLTLAEKAIKYGMMLKDATPYNVQLYNGNVIFIDSLSFEKLDATKPWIAYRQFCECFLAPLTLMHFLKTPLQPLLYAYPEGIPLPAVHKMLPLKSRFHLGCYLHLHLHAGYSKKNVGKKATPKFSEKNFRAILQSLKQTITSLHIQTNTVWSGYYNEAAQRPDYLQKKKQIIGEWIEKLPEIKTAVDIGANEGLFAEMLAAKGIRTIAADADPESINTLYTKVRTEANPNLIPLVVDVTNPGAAIGFSNEERETFTSRAKSDLVLALALEHHLAIGRNIPFHMLASFFRKLGKYLIIEFVPKEDDKIQEMLLHKKDIYDWYTQDGFEKAFQDAYHILRKQEIQPSGRTLYLMQQHEA